MYTSTRRKLSLNATNCILKGISDDGGLFIVNDFVSFPSIKILPSVIS